LVAGLCFSYSFRRLLIVTGCVAGPTFSTVLGAFVPMRLVIYHSIVANETLFLAVASLSITFSKTDQFALMLLAVWPVVSPESMAWWSARSSDSAT
jgi:hypothetical protein